MSIRCTHTMRRKERLVAWATDCEGTHTQGFKLIVCCTGCGAILDKKMIPAGVMK